MGRRMHRVIAGSILSAALCIGTTGLLSPAVATAQPTIELPEIPIPQPDEQQRADMLAEVPGPTGRRAHRVAGLWIGSG